jgi:two-component system KDP operon response regulator KdpE
MSDGKTILVIEDESAIRKLLRICLEPEGYKVREAAGGADGVLLAAQARPDLVILDLGLPDLDGIEVVRRIREWSPVPIIVLTVRDT